MPRRSSWSGIRTTAGGPVASMRHGATTVTRSRNYQSVQSENRFPTGDLLASFVVTEARKTVFVGLYRVAGVDPLPPGSVSTCWCGKTPRATSNTTCS